MTAPAPDDLVEVLRYLSLFEGADPMLARAAAALAARDAEIERLRAALQAIEVGTRDGADWNLDEINLCARLNLAAERTQGTP